MNTNCDIAIVGGGAAGLAAAIAAAQTARDAAWDASVVILETDERVGRSILKTGNGRCNFSHAQIAAGPGLVEYRNAPFVKAAYAALNAVYPEPDFNDPVLDFFERCGLEWRQEEDGRRYPLANKASVVLDVLRAEAKRLGVEEACGCAVNTIEPPRAADAPYTLRLADGRFWRAQAVVLAVGGAAAAVVNIAGLEAGPLQPVLGPLQVTQEDTAFTRELDNIRVRCSVSLFREEQSGELIHVHTETGELLFRPYGVSGICVFNLSRLAQAGDRVQINFLPMDDLAYVDTYIDARLKQAEKHLACPPNYEQFLRGLVVPRVADALIKRAGVNAHDTACADELFQMLCLCSLEVVGMGPADVCQVQRGGFAVDQLNPDTLEAQGLPGMYLAGEAVDVDGPCGGYNLHWAWASGLLAGHAASHQLLYKRGGAAAADRAVTANGADEADGAGAGRAVGASEANHPAAENTD